MDVDERLKWATDADLYREMVGTNGWDRHLEAMFEHEQEVVETFLVSASVDPQYLKGYVAGLRWATSHPTELIARVRALAKEGPRAQVL